MAVACHPYCANAWYLERGPLLYIKLLSFQVHTFYEAVGYMISAQTDPQMQEALIDKYMALPNQVIKELVSYICPSLSHTPIFKIRPHSSTLEKRMWVDPQRFRFKSPKMRNSKLTEK